MYIFLLNKNLLRKSNISVFVFNFRFVSVIMACHLLQKSAYQLICMHNPIKKKQENISKCGKEDCVGYVYLYKQHITPSIKHRSLDSKYYGSVLSTISSLVLFIHLQYIYWNSVHKSLSRRTDLCLS